MKPGIAIIVSAPSGTGKTTVCSRLREILPDLKFKISHTTREPRTGETDGVHYHFISEEQFRQSIDKGEFLEWAKVHRHYYGTLARTVRDNLDQGYDLLMELDVQGAESLRKLNFDGVFVFILPPSLEELEFRLKKRGTETPEKVSERLEVAKTEIAQYPLYDYVVTNRDIEETAQILLGILRSEKYRAHRYQPESPDLQALTGKNKVNV